MVRTQRSTHSLACILHTAALNTDADSCPLEVKPRPWKPSIDVSKFNACPTSGGYTTGLGRWLRSTMRTECAQMVYSIQSAVKWYTSHWGSLRCPWITWIYKGVWPPSLELKSTVYSFIQNRNKPTHGISAMFSGGGGMLLASKSSGMELKRLKSTALGDSTLPVWALAIFVLSSVRRFVCCNSVQDDGFSRSFACMLCKPHDKH